MPDDGVHFDITAEGAPQAAQDIGKVDSAAKQFAETLKQGPIGALGQLRRTLTSVIATFTGFVGIIGSAVLALASLGRESKTAEERLTALKDANDRAGGALDAYAKSLAAIGGKAKTHYEEAIAASRAAADAEIALIRLDEARGKIGGETAEARRQASLQAERERNADAAAARDRASSADEAVARIQAELDLEDKLHQIRTEEVEDEKRRILEQSDSNATRLNFEDELTKKQRERHQEAWEHERKFAEYLDKRFIERIRQNKELARAQVAGFEAQNVAFSGKDTTSLLRKILRQLEN